MKQLFSLLCLISFVIATDLTIKSDGTGADGNGISIQNSADTELMIIEGDGDASIDGTTLHIDATNNKVGLGTASPTTQLHVTGTEGLLVQGTYDSGTALNLGAGTRMHFYPKRAAFMVGYVSDTRWNDTSVGLYSFAAGYNCKAGDYSVAMGDNADATGVRAVALGDGTKANSESCVALGASSTASAFNSIAIGNGATASGEYSMAMGYNTTASGDYATVMGGNNTQATGTYATAMGETTTASGAWSTTMGWSTTAKSGFETAIGVWNTDYTPTETGGYNSADRLFVVGNGESSVSRSDALLILKNGNATLAGTLTQNSDRRLKERIRPIDSALEKVLKLEGKYYYWNEMKPHDTENEQIGLVAQDVAEVFPQLVTSDQTADAYLSVNYQGFVPVLINAIQEQQDQIDELKVQNEMLLRLLADNNHPEAKPGFFKRLFARFSPTKTSPNLTLVTP